MPTKELNKKLTDLEEKERPLARIRSIKPEFWTDEKIVELKVMTRLFFIGLWNFVDDEGRCKYSPKRLKLQILPADNADVEKLCAELRRASLINIYSLNDKEYLEICNFNQHQKIDKRTKSKIPPPNPPESPRIPTTDQGGDQGREGIKDQGRDQGGESTPDGAGPPVPEKEILNFYHEICCPPLPKILAMSPKREAALKARWQEKAQYRSLEFWQRFFTDVRDSDFLSGRASPRLGQQPFVADFEWLVKKENFLKVLEGRYKNRETKQKPNGRNRESANLEKNLQVTDKLREKWGIEPRGIFEGDGRSGSSLPKLGAEREENRNLELSSQGHGSP